MTIHSCGWLWKAVQCVTPATSDVPPVGEDRAGAVGEGNAYNQALHRSDSTNDALTLATTGQIGGQLLTIWALSG